MNTFTQPCSRFSQTRHPFNEQDAIIYSFLREKKCPKKNARSFAAKNICKYDASKQKLGPANFRIIQSKPHQFGQINGWQNISPKMKLPSTSIVSLKQFMDQQKGDSEIHEQFYSNLKQKLPEQKQIEAQKKKLDEKVEKEWKIKIDLQKNQSNVTFQQFNMEHKFQVNSLREKLNKKFNQNSEFYFNNQKYQEMSDLILQQRVGYIKNSSQKKQNSLLEKMKVSFDISQSPDLYSVRIKPFNSKKNENDSLYNQPNIKFESNYDILKINDEQIQTLLTEQSDEDNSSGEQSVWTKQKKKIKQILQKGYKQNYSKNDSNFTEESTLAAKQFFTESSPKIKGDQINYKSLNKLIRNRNSQVLQILQRSNTQKKQDFQLQDEFKEELPQKMLSEKLIDGYLINQKFKKQKTYFISQGKSQK